MGVRYRNRTAVPMLHRVLAAAAVLGLFGHAQSGGTKGLVEDVTLHVDWGEFLSHHDLLWSWTWGDGGRYTLQPTHVDLARCGPNATSGACCLQADSTTLPASRNARTVRHHHRADGKNLFPGALQLALYNRTQWACSPTAFPPRECCLPVPGSSAVSGCHAATDSRWNYNQFFTVSLNGNGTFTLTGKGA